MKQEIPESVQDRAEKYLQEATATAQRISNRWQELIEAVKTNPLLLSDNPKLEEVFNMNKPPKAGIQTYFESQIEFIDTAGGKNSDARSRMIYRLKEELERIEREVESLLENT